MLFHEINSDHFVSLDHAAYITLGDGIFDGLVHFLNYTPLDDFLKNGQISGSATTSHHTRWRVNRTVGESPLACGMSGATTHDIRPSLPPKLAGNERSQHLVRTNPLVSFHHGILTPHDRALYPDPEVPVGFNIMHGLGSNIDITFEVTRGTPESARIEFFERLTRHHQIMEGWVDNGHAISIVQQGPVSYVNYDTRYGVYHRGVNFFFWPEGYDDTWVTGSSSRLHQHRPLGRQDGQLGFIPDPRFFDEPGELLRHPHNRGDHLAEVARELRRVATNPGHQAKWDSYRISEPLNPAVSFAHATLILVNLFVADYYAQYFGQQPDLVWETLDLLGLKPLFGRVAVQDMKDLLQTAQDGIFLPPDLAMYPDYYPNVNYHQLTDLASQLAPFLIMPKRQYLQLGDTAARQLFVTATNIL